MEKSLVAPYKDLHIKYNVKGSYYTAYPPSGLWSEQFSEADYREALNKVFENTPDLPLQLYVHFPYCIEQCYYCQCFQFATKDRKRIQDMLTAIISEIRLLKNFFDQIGVEPKFKEIHLGVDRQRILKLKNLISW